MLDASGWEDNAKLQAYIDKWQAYADEIESECSRRKLGVGGQARQPATDISSDLSTGTDDAENMFYSPMTAQRAADDIEHRDGRNGNAINHRLRRVEDTVEVDGSNATLEEEEIRGYRTKQSFVWMSCP